MENLHFEGILLVLLESACTYIWPQEKYLCLKKDTVASRKIACREHSAPRYTRTRKTASTCGPPPAEPRRGESLLRCSLLRRLALQALAPDFLQQQHDVCIVSGIEGPLKTREADEALLQGASTTARVMHPEGAPHLPHESSKAPLCHRPYEHRAAAGGQGRFGCAYNKSK